jgi:ATP-dependent Clp protease adaptor protein ClpS
MSTDVKLSEKIVVEFKPPSLWKVVFLNDDKTPMEFVIDLLTSIFRHTETDAKELTLEIHNTGSAVVGIYCHEIAEQKTLDAQQTSQVQGHPLQIIMDPET